jgi:hypothetical protein
MVGSIVICVVDQVHHRTLWPEGCRVCVLVKREQIWFVIDGDGDKGMH